MPKILKITSLFITGTVGYSYQGNNSVNKNMQIIKDKVILITNPDILITKDILRSEVLNELNYKLKESELLRRQKEEELKYKKLYLLEKELETKYKVNDLKDEEINTKLLNEKFNQLKIKKRIDYLNEYPFTTLSFEPKEIDLINNIVKSNIEEEKIKKMKLLKKVNENNLKILKKQYLLLKEFEKNFSNLYYSIEYANDYNMALKIFENIEVVIVQLLQTNILYMQEDFSEFRIELIKLKNLISKLIIESQKGSIKKAKEIKAEILNEYNNILKKYYKIRNSLLSNIIKLQQINQNEFKLIELINFKYLKNKNKLILKQIRNFSKKDKKTDNKKEKKSKILLDYKKKLAAELNIPLKYLDLLTYEDVMKIKINEQKIEFYKKLISKLESKVLKKKELKKIGKILKIKDTDPIVIENKILDIITKLIQEKYSIIKKRINEYKKREFERKEKLRKLKELLRKKQELERKRRLLEEKRRKQRLEMLRIKKLEEERIRKQKMLEEKRRLEKLRRIRKLKQELKNELDKYIYIGVINNQLILESLKTNEIVYVKQGTVLEGNNKVLSIDIKNKKMIIFNEDKNKKFIYDIKNKKIKLLD